MKKIAKLVRDKNHKTEPICVELFLRLRIKQVEQRKGKDEKDKDRKKIDRNQVSRAQNKQRKKEAKLAKEMVELQAAENQQDRIRLTIRLQLHTKCNIYYFFIGITLLSTPLMVRINCVYEFDDLLILSFLSSSIADCFSYCWTSFIAVNDILDPLRSLLFSLLVVRLKFNMIGVPSNAAPWWSDRRHFSPPLFL